MSVLVAVIGLIAMAVMSRAALSISTQWRDEASAWRVAYFAHLSVHSGERDKSEFIDIPDKLKGIIASVDGAWAQTSIEERVRELFKLHGNWDTTTAQIMREIEG